ncbi:enoyl-CoA hydratase-related protein [Photobacterium aphoticum]|uniref:Methylglutaconyl-CoA hydratase n=1 Tax=Photobacterium aphoticum TaxID=754436 RepID=A0A0J1GQ81_9GAMM|nr:enoyl-CoA hydratase-related protein [Photobacterium aphoticum]KLV01923.1 hypothetical protein ABT58_05845 [Photobacterium aphoticum]PSU60161.1 gamma-carboxygeranoyl-CoA hydratase [Photobacterium aphoticum]GHA33660.1 gamma-carboxygeranoyl-CoA hydratase [Photobacterium aphoticum]
MPSISVTTGKTSDANGTDAHIRCDIDDRGVATLTLDRPDKHNAFNAQTINQLLVTLKQLKGMIVPDDGTPPLRVLLLQASGKHFSAGADLSWMQSMVSATQEENYQDALQLAALLHTLDTFPVPTVARVQGNAYGGAIGLLCCCDVVLATASAQCCLSEVKIGLAPATISPYVCRVMGQRHARRFMLTAEPIDSELALTTSLFHRVLPDEASLDIAIQDTIAHLLRNSPDAMQISKSLCHLCDSTPLSEALRQETARIIAAVRASPQGQEGLNAFLNKRVPHWQNKPYRNDTSEDNNKANEQNNHKDMDDE